MSSDRHNAPEKLGIDLEHVQRLNIISSVIALLSDFSRSWK